MDRKNIFNKRKGEEERGIKRERRGGEIERGEGRETETERDRDRKRQREIEPWKLQQRKWSEN